VKKVGDWELKMVELMVASKVDLKVELKVG
jgi:hypothetical protein